MTHRIFPIVGGDTLARSGKKAVGIKNTDELPVSVKTIDGEENEERGTVKQATASGESRTLPKGQVARSHGGPPASPLPWPAVQDAGFSVDAQWAFSERVDRAPMWRSKPPRICWF